MRSETNIENTKAGSDCQERIVRPAFAPREMVSHITDESSSGIIVAFMLRGSNHSYEVQWGIEKCTWHLNFELNPHFPALRSVPLALSGASRRKQTPSSKGILMVINFVQFPHPGEEHSPDVGLVKKWNTGAHRRKFLCCPGEYVTESGKIKEADLLFWGEWEPPSDVQVLQGAATDKLMPQWLHRPQLPLPDSGLARAAASSGCKPTKQIKGTCGGGHCAGEKVGLQNTDPFVFGSCFKYFICKQFQRIRQKNKTKSLARSTWLSKLERGSVILFGSTHGTGANAFFQLDTVFVVERSISYNPAKPENLPIDPLVDPDFLKASFHTALPVTDCVVPDDLELRLYLGATIEKPVNGMYSFSPAKILKGEPKGFSRVRLQSKDLQLPGRSNLLTNNLNSAPKKSEVTENEARALWDAVLSKCLDHGCVPGVRFHLRP